MDKTSLDASVDEFLGKYTPAIEAQLREARQRLCALFPRGYELIFDNYNALVFGISPTENSRESFISVAGYPKWVTLFFLDGASLHDPLGLLEGDGKQVRSIRLKEPAQIDSPEVRALIAQASAPRQADLNQAPPLISVIKTVVDKQRPRRPAVKESPKTSPVRKPR